MHNSKKLLLFHRTTAKDSNALPIILDSSKKDGFASVLGKNGVVLDIHFIGYVMKQLQ